VHPQEEAVLAASSRIRYGSGSISSEHRVNRAIKLIDAITAILVAREARKFLLCMIKR